MEKEKGRERVRDGGPGVVEKYFSVLTRCLRSVFPYLYGVLGGERDGAKPARKSARCGVGDGSPRPHLPHPQQVGSGPRPQALKDGQSGVEERPTPDAPHPGKRRPPRAPSSRPHSAQSQLARARAEGFF